MSLNPPDFDFSGFDSAIGRNIIPGLDSADQKLRIFRRRLFWLGYLEEEGEELSDQVLAEALSEFQNDAGLATSGKPDKATFDALDAFVAFEPNVRSCAFLKSLPDNNTVLNKARQLRLRSYGLVPKRSSSRQIEQSISLFNSLCYSLYIPGIKQNMKVRDLDEFIFNLDKLTMTLQGDESGIKIRIPPRFRTGKTVKNKFKVKIKNFVYHLASIELWLSGYPVRLNKLNTTSDNFQKALKTFWSDAPERTKPPKKYRKIASFAFFKRINELQKVSPDDERTEQKILSRLEADNIYREEIQKQSLNFVGRLYDGIKRAIKVVFDLFKRGLKLATSLLKNSARWFVSSANKIYQGIKTIFKAARVGMMFVKNDNDMWNDSRHIVIRKNIDFDHQIYINIKGDSKEQNKMLRRYELAASLFSVALQGIGAIWKVLSKLIRLFSGVASWFLALWSLLKLNEEVIHIELIVNKANELLKKWDLQVDAMV